MVLKDERINPDELRDYSETDTVTKVEGGEISLSKEFVRDIRKLWVKTDGRKVYLCIENQTELDVKDQVRMTFIYSGTHPFHYGENRRSITYRSVNNRLG